MYGELRIRRAAVTAAVVGLHIFLLLVLLGALRPPTAVKEMREIVVRMLSPAPERNPEREPVSRLPQPIFIQPVTPQAIAPPLPPPAATPTAPSGDIRALGRYLTNCTGAEYERLSPREKAHCLANQWEGGKEPPVLLGKAKPSPFDAVIAGRHAIAPSPVQPCDVTAPNANLGVGCMNFPHSSDPGLLSH